MYESVHAVFVLHVVRRFWREVKVGVCHAPQFYDGSCPRVLDVRNMSDEAKGSWSTKCGTMWPCQDDAALGCVRDYQSDACPVGWRRSGMDCVAPASYVGCHSIQQFDKFAPSDKREWEQSCGALPLFQLKYKLQTHLIGVMTTHVLCCRTFAFWCRAR